MNVRACEFQKSFFCFYPIFIQYMQFNISKLIEGLISSRYVVHRYMYNEILCYQDLGHVIELHC